MKTLNSILKTQDGFGFPVRGMNGYGGEQDGDRVLFAGFNTATKASAKSILIPDAAGLHWARYSPRCGWEGAVGVWASQFTEEDDAKTPLEFT